MHNAKKILHSTAREFNLIANFSNQLIAILEQSINYVKSYFLQKLVFCNFSHYQSKMGEPEKNNSYFFDDAAVAGLFLRKSKCKVI